MFGHCIVDTLILAKNHQHFTDTSLILVLCGSRHLGHVSCGHSIGHNFKENEQSVGKLSVLKVLVDAGLKDQPLC